MGHTLSVVRRPREQGFSLTELLIVIMIMGLLIGFTLSQMDIFDKAKVQNAETQLNQIKIHLEMYRTDNGSFPPSGALSALVSNPGAEVAPRWKPYMKELPKDPWGNEYRYLNPGTHGKEVDVYSVGADKLEGTDDDIGSWRLER